MACGCASLLAMLVCIVAGLAFGLTPWLLAAIIVLALMGYGCLVFGAP